MVKSTQCCYFDGKGVVISISYKESYQETGIYDGRSYQGGWCNRNWRDCVLVNNGVLITSNSITIVMIWESGRHSFCVAVAQRVFAQGSFACSLLSLYYHHSFYCSNPWMVMNKVIIILLPLPAMSPIILPPPPRPRPPTTNMSNIICWEVKGCSRKHVHSTLVASALLHLTMMNSGHEYSTGWKRASQPRPVVERPSW
jgi:hypothetical protein